MSDAKPKETKQHWLVKENEEWFVCFSKRIHGQKRIVKISVAEINEKIKAAN